MQKHGYEDRQWHCGLGHTSRSLQRGTWHKVEIHRQWPSGETPRFSKGTKVIECSIENFVTVVAVTKQKVVPSIEFSSAKGNFESGQGVEDTMMDLFKPFREGSDVHDASYSTPQAGVAQSKESSVPNQQETIMCSLLVFTHYPNIPIVRSVRRQKQHEPGVERNLRSAWTGLHFLQHLEPWSRRITKFWPMKTSRDADTKTL